MEPWLSLVIHDSDIGIIRYAPIGAGTGEAFMGTTPRVYFENESASMPTDVAREARGLAVWAQAALPGTGIDAESLSSFLASDDEPDGPAEDSDLADIFVEIKSARFLTALGLPLPDDLRGGDV